MKIALLCRNSNLYSHQRIIEAGESIGLEVIPINFLKCDISVSAQGSKIYNENGKELCKFDAIIPRIGASVTFYGTAIVRQFEMMGVYTLNESLAIARSRDKLRALQIMSRKGINMPITAFAHSDSNPDVLIKLAGGAPVVIKLLEGTQGKGVMLAETKKAAASMIGALQGLNADILVQEYIEEAGGEDIRCIVLGSKVIASMKRKAGSGEFRSNLHVGGVASKVRTTLEEKQLAIKAAKVIGLNFAGVDIMRSKNGPMVIEVNSSPGLEGIEKTTNIDIASKILQFVKDNATKNKTIAKGKG